MKNVRCPFCGYKMPIRYVNQAVAQGIYVRCKGRKCRKIFEIKINVK